MDVYGKIKKIGPEAKSEADAFIQGLTRQYTKENPAPPEVMQKGLEGILAKYQPKAKSPVASSPWVFSGRVPYAAGLAAVLLAVALASLGMPPYMPPVY